MRLEPYTPPPRPTREPAEDRNGYLIRLLLWYDRAAREGLTVDQLGPLSEAEVAEVLSAWPTVRAIAWSLCLIPKGMHAFETPPPAAAEGKSPRGRKPTKGAGSPTASSADTSRGRSGRGRRGRKEGAP